MTNSHCKETSDYNPENNDWEQKTDEDGKSYFDIKWLEGEQFPPNIGKITIENNISNWDIIFFYFKTRVFNRMIPIQSMEMMNYT